MSTREVAALENPPWVDRILNKHWDKIQLRIGPDLMPVADDVSPMSRRKKKTFTEYGCGHYGCVLPTSSRGRVFKVSSDPTEAAFVVASTQIKASTPDGDWPAGIVDYYAIYRTPDSYQRRPVFVLVREEAQNVGALASRSDVERRFVRRLGQFKTWAAEARNSITGAPDPLRLMRQAADYREWAEDRVDWNMIDRQYPGGFNLMDPRIHLPKPEKIAYARRACEILAETMEQEDVGYLVGGALKFFLEHDLLLADVHSDNVGQVDRSPAYGKLVWAITDPGHMVPLDPRWTDLAVPEL